MNAKKLSVLALILSSILVNPSFANEKPQGIATDNRIKVVAYDPNNVVTVVGSHLVETGVEFDPDEAIISIMNGDQVAWTIGVDKTMPYMFNVKPILPSSDTNLTVTTNKRQYLFHLITSPSETAHSRNVTYLVKFRYPLEEKTQLQSQINDLQRNFLGPSTDPVQWNYNYSFHGSKQLAPIQAVDNGRFTIFKFPKSSPTPAIFAVDKQGNESLVNFRVQGDYVFVQGINRLYTLRNGDEVTSVYNDTYGS